MPTLYIRDVPNAVYDCLRERALRHRRSLTKEAITILEEWLGTIELPKRLLSKHQREKAG